MAEYSSTSTGGTFDSGWIHARVVANTSYTSTSSTVTVTVKCYAVPTYSSVSSSWLKGKATKDANGNYGDGANVTLSGSTILMKTESFSVTRGTSDKTITCRAYVWGYGGGGIYDGDYDTASVSVTIPKLTTYTISYNANGGNTTTTPAAQTKYRDVNLTLSKTIPTKNITNSTSYTVTLSTNYPSGENTPLGNDSTKTVTATVNWNFNYWASTAAGATPTYTPGATYTENSTATLYAQWAVKSINYPSISFPDKTLNGYTFHGWATNPTATSAQYVPGSSLTITSSNQFYGVWIKNYIDPIISTLTTKRIDVDNNDDNNGIYCKTQVSWINGTGSVYKIEWQAISNTMTPTTITATLSFNNNTWSVTSSTSNYPVTILSSDLDTITFRVKGLSIDNSWDISTSVIDDNNHKIIKKTILSAAFFTMDFLKGGHGITIGGPAVTTDFHIAMSTIHEDKPIIIKDNTIDRDGTSVSSNYYSKIIGFQDKDDENIAYIQANQKSDGTIGASLVCYGEDGNGNAVSNVIRANVAANGTKNYEISDPTAFRTALNIPTIGGTSGNYWNLIPKIESDGVMEIGKFLDFHATADDTSDYKYRITADTNYLKLSGGLILDNHAGPIGSTTSASGTVSVAAAEKKAACSVSLNPGKWVVTGNVYFKVTGSGYRVLSISSTSGSISNGATYHTIQLPGVSGYYSMSQIVAIIENTSTTTYYLNVQAESAATIEGCLRAIRIA